jgi:hypothetical protein
MSEKEMKVLPWYIFLTPCAIVIIASAKTESDPHDYAKSHYEN